MTPIKPWYKSLTLWIAVLQGVAGILAIVVSQHPELGYVAVVKSIIDMYVRSQTNTAITS